MHIICPQCATSYQVDAAALGARGRSVRCARCRTGWFAAADGTTHAQVAQPVAAGVDEAEQVAAFRQELGADTGVSPAAAMPEPPPASEPDAPPPEEPGPDDTPPVSADGEPAPDAALPVENAPPLAPDQIEAQPAEPEVDIETVAHRRPSRAKPRGPLPRLPLVIAALAAVLLALLMGRTTVVRHAPQMASLYAAIGLPVNLRGLALTEVSTTRASHDGVSMLVVEGVIVNTTSMAVPVPRLRFAVQSSSGAEIYAWTAQPPQPELAAGASLPFRSRLASPPEDGRSVMVRFFNRRDAAAER